ncbi:Translation elongation factor P Lys34:lysine transferase [Minicystis rosea]|nr:Translation elongation factor P Lys34:lysine transferase [Minicystis rosea]
MSAPRLSPSDLTAHLAAAPVELAGRVIALDGATVTLADALAEARATLATPAPLAVGDLVVLAGSLADGALHDARLVTHSTPRRPPGSRAPSADPPAGEVDRLRHRGLASGLVARARALRAIRSFFDERGFLEVDTPAIVPSPGLDLHLDAFAVPGAAGPGFTDATGYLITSPEYQMKRLLTGGIARCFQIGHCFRQGEIGSRHNPEFTMLEWYRSFAAVDEVIADTEALVRHVARALGNGDALTVGGVRVDLTAPFERLSVADAFARHAGVDPEEAIALATRDEDRFFRLLVDAVEPALAHATHPVFLVDYPAPFASLARLREGDPRVAERFELYVAGVELCNGFGELTDPIEQRTRLERDQAERRRVGKPVYPIDERFLSALEEGMPPSAGNALGVDRLIAVCLGTDRIGDVSAFPVSWL